MQGIKSRVSDILNDKLEKEFIHFHPSTDKGLALSNNEAGYIPHGQDNKAKSNKSSMLD